MTKLVFLCGVLASGCIITSSEDPVCGDGAVDSGEQCDDGNNVSGDGCSATCAIEPYCGDGVLDSGEECDDGNNTNGDNCSSTCVIEPFCGDGFLDPNETCDDGNNLPSDGCSPTCATEAKFATTANWTFRSTAAPGTPLACPVGFDTVAVVSQALDANGADLGTPIVDLFNCSSMTGTITPVFEGRYRTHLDVTNNAGTLTYASSLSAIVDLTASNKTFTAQISTDGGYFAVTWALQGATSNTALTCAQVTGQDGVDLVSTDIANANNAFADTWNCVDGQGITAALPAATYSLSLSIIDGVGASLGTAPTLTNKVIMAPNKLTDLGTVTIPVDGL